MAPLLLIPGPSPVVERILEALARPTVSHVGADMAADTSLALANLKRIVFCAEGQPFLVAGAGTLAMEIALLNLAGADMRILILSQGYFGDRMGEMARAFGLEHDLVQSPWGRITTPDDLRRRLAGRRYGIVVATHVDTASGGCIPVREYAAAVREAGGLFVLDGVAATGGLEERMDDWGIDVVLTAAQKCFGAPPGLAIDVFSPAAMARRQALGTIRAYYADILRWLPVMNDPARYFSTPCVNEHRAFAEATRIMMEEGMDGALPPPSPAGPGGAGRFGGARFRPVHGAGLPGGHALRRPLSRGPRRCGLPDGLCPARRPGGRRAGGHRRARLPDGPHGEPHGRPGRAGFRGHGGHAPGSGPPVRNRFLAPGRPVRPG